VTWIGMVDE